MQYSCGRDGDFEGREAFAEEREQGAFEEFGGLFLHVVFGQNAVGGDLVTREAQDAVRQKAFDFDVDRGAPRTCALTRSRRRRSDVAACDRPKANVRLEEQVFCMSLEGTVTAERFEIFDRKGEI